MYNNYFSNFGRPLVPDDLCKDSAPGHPRFWRRFLKVFTIYGHDGHLGQQTTTILAIFRSPNLRRLHMKFEQKLLLVCEAPSKKRLSERCRKHSSEDSTGLHIHSLLSLLIRCADRCHSTLSQQLTLKDNCCVPTHMILPMEQINKSILNSPIL